MKPYKRFNPVMCVNSDARHNRSAISDSLWRP
ncbi:positive regulator for repZ translation [Salmonella enterica]|nr:positive regulator for repZ translation [Salmonella enterica]